MNYILIYAVMTMAGGNPTKISVESSLVPDLQMCQLSYEFKVNKIKNEKEIPMGYCVPKHVGRNVMNRTGNNFAEIFKVLKNNYVGLHKQ